MERPPADPAKLLAAWDEWEAGEVTPGRAVSNLKTGGLRDVVEHLAADPEATAPAGVDVTTVLAVWMEWEVGTRAPLPLLESLRDEGMRSLLAALVETATASAPSGDGGT